MFTLKNIPADQFSEILSELHACGEARKFASGKDLRQALRECPDVEWIEWFIDKAGGRFGMPTREAFHAAVKPAWEACDAAVESAREAYHAAVKPAWEACDAATKSAREAYHAAVESARDACDAATKSAWEAYDAAVEALFVVED